MPYSFQSALETALLRRRSIGTPITTAYRLLNGAGDGTPGLVIDRWGNALLIESAQPPPDTLCAELLLAFPGASLYHKTTTPQIRRLSKKEAAPVHLSGPALHGKFSVLENGLRFGVSLEEGYSTGLFLDQRDNRRRILEMDLAGKAVLNTFAYTCSFSVCAARAGATVTSLDLSKKYLAWGRENFQASGLDDASHDFIFGDVFDWMPRLAKKGRRFDLIILDPPTFSTAKSRRTFKAEKDYPQLIALAKDCLASDGRVLACINSRDTTTAAFKRVTGIRQTLPLPPDFPIHPGTNPHLKSGWLHL